VCDRGAESERMRAVESVCDRGAERVRELYRVCVIEVQRDRESVREL
jgi:hypothetical protein